MSATWNFSTIQTVTRQISGQLSATGLSNVDLDFWINSYYQYDLPRELKIEELYQQYTFTLFPGVATYDLPGTYGNNPGPFTHVEPKLFIDGYPIFYTQDTNVFYSRIPILWNQETLLYGDGVTTTFAFNTTLFPLVPNQPSSVIVTDGSVVNGIEASGSETFSDDGNGNLISNLSPGGSGTVNYTTGAISVTFNTAPTSGTPIITTYNYQVLARPNTVMLYARQFTFYPVPDTAYSCRIDAYFQPPALVNSSDVPIKPEWGEIIAVGASMKILRNYGQFEKYQEMQPYYQKERSKVMSDTDNQLMATRSAPTC